MNVPMISKRQISCLAIMVVFGLGFWACSPASEEMPVNTGAETESEEGQGATGNLPALPSVSGHCMEPGYELSLEQWIQYGDGLIFGTVTHVEPALDMGWSPVPIEGGSHEDRLIAAPDCVEVRNGFKVTLNNLDGFLHDDELPDSMDIYFGAGAAGLFAEGAPITANDEIIWPGDAPIFVVGMEIGGLVFHSDLADRWSFAPLVRRPIFQITDAGIEFQETDSDICGEWPPIEELTGKTREELANDIQELDEMIGLYLEPENRFWSTKSDSNHYLFMNNWLATCLTADYLELREEEM